jgi:hypothetical protein
MMNAVQQMKKKAAMLRDVTLPMVRQFFSEYERDTVIAHLHAQFATFLQDAQVESIPLTGPDAENVFELYFGRRAPFGQGKKKSEFPDAFIVASLDRWCRERNEKMYVITGDGAERQPKDTAGGAVTNEDVEGLKSMMSACHETGTLLPLPRVSMFLELVTRAEENELVGIARAGAVAEWASVNRTLVAEYLTDNFADFEFVPDDFESEVEEVYVLGVRVGTPELIELDEDRAVLAFGAKVRYEASVRTIDPESGVWDSEEEVMLFQEHHKVTRQYSTTVEGEVTVVVPRIEELGLAETPETIAKQIELEDIDVSNTTIDVPIEDIAYYSNDPAQIDVFG